MKLPDVKLDDKDLLLFASCFNSNLKEADAMTLKFVSPRSSFPLGLFCRFFFTVFFSFFFQIPMKSAADSSMLAIKDVFAKMDLGNNNSLPSFFPERLQLLPPPSVLSSV